MEYNELQHWGIKGMKWGVRRFQNKDGTLTEAGKKRKAKLEDELGKLEGTGKGKSGSDSDVDPVAQKRAKLLSSTDAKELYDNRNLLTTNEINDRLNRINAEARLKDLSEGPKQSGYEAVDKMLKFGRKVNEVYEFTKTPVMKSLIDGVKKKMGIDEVEKSLGLDKVYELKDKLSDKEIQDALNRARNENAIKEILNPKQPKKSISLEEASKIRDTLTDDQLQEILKRATTEKVMDEMIKKKKEEAGK